MSPGPHGEAAWRDASGALHINRLPERDPNGAQAWDDAPNSVTGGQCLDTAAPRQFIYLASPYSHDDAAVRDARWRAAAKGAASLMNTLGAVVFSPIAHYHPIDEHLPRHPQEFWDATCAAYMERCDCCAVLMFPGWKESRGVTREIAWFKARGRSVFYVWAGEP